MIVSQAHKLCSNKTPDVQDAAAVALARAFRWKARLESGEYSSVADLARSEKQKPSQVYSLLRLSLLAPSIIDGILSGTVSSPLGEMTMWSSKPWEEQCSILKITG
jgi:hypothetical protein